MAGMTRPHNQPTEVEAAQQMTDAPLGQHNAEPLGNGARQISPAPAHHAVPGRVGAAAHPLGYFRLLIR